MIFVVSNAIQPLSNALQNMLQQYPAVAYMMDSYLTRTGDGKPLLATYSKRFENNQRSSK